MSEECSSTAAFDGIKPYIVQKDVILCRSGIQMYAREELLPFIADGNGPKEDKRWYREYRPASVVVRAKELCSSLPVTKEHPDGEWVDGKNWKALSGGTTDREVEVVALEGEAEGEIGLKSSLTFYDEDLYNYYLQNNREVSLGYTCAKHWVDNPEECGYDIILDEITGVNHLAVTQMGRGGKSVAVIDSYMKGVKPMRTGVFAWLKSLKQTDSRQASFGEKVMDALKKSPNPSEEDVRSVLDSCAVLKDCAEKEVLMNAVRDCFDSRDMSLAGEKELAGKLTAMFDSLHEMSLKEFDACPAKEGEKKEEDSASEEAEDKNCDSEEEGKEEEKEEDAVHEEVPSDEKLDSVTKDSLLQAVNDSLPSVIRPMVEQAVKEYLGLGEDKAEAKGIALDSNIKPEGTMRDYSEFLEG